MLLFAFYTATEIIPAGVENTITEIITAVLFSVLGTSTIVVIAKSLLATLVKKITDKITAAVESNRISAETGSAMNNSITRFQANTDAKIDDMQAKIVERDGQINALIQRVEQRDEKIDNLLEFISRYDGMLAEIAAEYTSEVLGNESQE